VLIQVSSSKMDTYILIPRTVHMQYVYWVKKADERVGKNETESKNFQIES